MNRMPGQPPREIAFNPREEVPRFQETATPGIYQANPSQKVHVVAGEAPTQWYRAPFATLLTPGASDQQVIEWRIKGEVIGIQLGSDLGDAESLSSLGLKLTVGGEQRAIGMNGQSGSPDFIKFAAIVGIQPLTVAPLYTPVCSNDKWFVEVQNFNIHAHSYLPEVTFWFRGQQSRPLAGR